MEIDLEELKNKKLQIIQCPKSTVIALRDSLNVFNGKWKMAIIGSLMYDKKRFKDLEMTIPEISPRMLSRELKDLELNGIINRNVTPSTPIRIEYELTPSGHALEKVIHAMVEWGLDHRAEFLKHQLSENS